MCILRIGIRQQPESLPLPIPCVATDVAVAWTEQVALEGRKAWPKTATRLGLWPDEPPVVIRMEDVFYVGVEVCSNYRVLKSELVQKETDHVVIPDSSAVASPLSGS